MASITGVLYIGMTNGLTRRIFEHKNNLVDGFTKEYSCHKLVYFESSNDVKVALDREKQIKKWRRDKKVQLIESINPRLEDLSLQFN